MNIFDPDPEVIDTTSVCARNSIADITFYEQANFILSPPKEDRELFPFALMRETKQREDQRISNLTEHLKDGIGRPTITLQDDWLIIVIFSCAFLYSAIRSFSGRLLPEFSRFFLFRGIGDPASRDQTELFHWQSTLLNLVSFLNTALFIYCAADILDLIPDFAPGILFMLLSFGIVVLAITIRHIACYITGIVSEERGLFYEYMLTVYQSYRYASLIFFVIVILIAYTPALSDKILLISGFCVAVFFYLMRVTRLFFIFMNRNLSILYLILYLCALEFLPAGICIRYIAGLF